MSKTKTLLSITSEFQAAYIALGAKPHKNSLAAVHRRHRAALKEAGLAEQSANTMYVRFFNK